MPDSSPASLPEPAGPETGSTVGLETRSATPGSAESQASIVGRLGWREALARMVEDYPGPDPSPADPAWWAGYQEARRDFARIVRSAQVYDPEADDDA